MGDEAGTTSYEHTAELYDYVQPYVERQDVEFYVELAREAGGEVLELGCGTGRVLLPIARAGVPITGLDASPTMLRVLRSKLEREPAEVRGRVQVVEGDMRAFDLGRRFPLITTPFRSFQHMLEVEEQLACLAAVRRHLAGGGRFVLDIFNPALPRLAAEVPGAMVVEPGTLPDGSTLERRSRVVAHDRARQVIRVEMRHEITRPGGQVEVVTERFPMRYFFRYEAEHLLARAGFRVEALYADFDRSPYGSAYPGELLFVCRL